MASASNGSAWLWRPLDSKIFVSASGASKHWPTACSGCTPVGTKVNGCLLSVLDQGVLPRHSEKCYPALVSKWWLVGARRQRITVRLRNERGLAETDIGPCGCIA